MSVNHSLWLETVAGDAAWVVSPTLRLHPCIALAYSQWVFPCVEQITLMHMNVHFLIFV